MAACDKSVGIGGFVFVASALIGLQRFLGFGQGEAGISLFEIEAGFEVEESPGEFSVRSAVALGGARELFSGRAYVALITEEVGSHPAGFDEEMVQVFVVRAFAGRDIEHLDVAIDGVEAVSSVGGFPSGLTDDGEVDQVSNNSAGMVDRMVKIKGLTIGLHRVIEPAFAVGSLTFLGISFGFGDDGRFSLVHHARGHE